MSYCCFDGKNPWFVVHNMWCSFLLCFFIHKVFGIVNSQIEIEKKINVVSVITNYGGLGWGLRIWIT